jgi:hypothetical protein
MGLIVGITVCASITVLIPLTPTKLDFYVGNVHHLPRGILVPCRLVCDIWGQIFPFSLTKASRISYGIFASSALAGQSFFRGS